MIDLAFAASAADQLSHKTTEHLSQEEIGSLVMSLMTGLPSTVVMEGRLSGHLMLGRLRGMCDVELPSGALVVFTGEHAVANALAMSTLVEAGSPLLVSAMEMLPEHLLSRGADWLRIKPGTLRWSDRNFPALILGLEKARGLQRGLSLGTQVS